MLAALAVLCAFYAAPAAAQATRTWISGVGDDANPCSRTAPCKTFAGAISKTATGGEINVLDPGGFGAVTITKSITLRADGDNGGILVSGTNGIVVNAPTNARVVIDGLDLEGLDSGINGVSILQARDVTIKNTNIRNFATSGVSVNSNAGSKLRVVIDSSKLLGNGIGVRVLSPDGRAVVTVLNTLINASDNIGVSVITTTTTGNALSISGSAVINTPVPFEIGAGTTVSSYGDNVVGPGGATPTIIPKK